MIETAMKYNRLVVILENKSGSMYQVALNPLETNMVANLIEQLHNKKIRILPGKLPFKLQKKVKL